MPTRLAAPTVADAVAEAATEASTEEADWLSSCAVAFTTEVALAIDDGGGAFMFDGIALRRGALPAPAMREKRVAARIPRSIILRLTMSTQTRPKKRSAARIRSRSRVSAFCIVVIRFFDALRRPEKEVY